MKWLREHRTRDSGTAYWLNESDLSLARAKQKKHKLSTIAQTVRRGLEAL